jgi:group I intron endonuclease
VRDAIEGGVVYKLTNIFNGKAYVGKHEGDDHTDRINEHVRTSRSKGRGRNYAVHNAISKYGIEAFDIEVLERCGTAADLLFAEKWHILLCGTYYSGYNGTFGGEGRSGHSPSVKTRALLSAAMKAFWTPEKREAAAEERDAKHWSALRKRFAASFPISAARHRPEV